MRRVFAVIIAALLVIVGFGADSMLRDRPEAGTPYEHASLSSADLITADATRVFFAHQSVGGNILDGVPGVFRTRGLPSPRVVELDAAQSTDRLISRRVGKNGDPLGKISEFDALIRSGLGTQIDAAILKLCYSDIRADTDLSQVLTAYTDTLAALERDFPDVAFIPATVPLSIQRSRVGNLKELLGRGDRHGPEHNVARERFNASLRAAYADAGPLFDVAAIESTSTDGSRTAARHDGALYYSLDRALAKDPGHLNATGATLAAEGLLSVIARTASR